MAIDFTPNTNGINEALLQYDATIGTGGDYPATSIADGLVQAVTDGKFRLKVISDFTVWGNIGIVSKELILYSAKQNTISLSISNTSNIRMRMTNITMLISGTNKIFTEYSHIELTNCVLKGDGSINNFNYSTNITKAGIFAKNLTIDTGSFSLLCLVNEAIGLSLIGGGITCDNSIHVITRAENINATGVYSTFTGGSAKYSIIARKNAVLRNVIKTATNFRISLNANCKIYNAQAQIIEVVGDISKTIIENVVLNSILYINQVGTTGDILSLSNSSLSFISNAGATGGAEGVSRVISVKNTRFNHWRKLNIYTFNAKFSKVSFSAGLPPNNVKINGAGNVFDGNCNFNSVTVKGYNNTITDSVVSSGKLKISPVANNTVVKGCRTLTRIANQGTNTKLVANNLL